MTRRFSGPFIAVLVIVSVLSAGVGRLSVAGDVEQRIADFWKRVDALGPGDHLSAGDVGQWALNVIERDSRTRITVADFRASAGGLQAAFDRAGPAPAAAHAVALTVTSPVARGSTATARATTTASSSCTITVTYSSGASSAQGLGPKAADGAGAVSWSWTVGATTTLGAWPVDVACTSPAGQSATTRATFTVQ